MDRDLPGGEQVYTQQWFQNYQSALVFFIKKEIGYDACNTDQAEDLLLEVFARAQRSLQKKDPAEIEYPQRWLEKIASRVCAEFLKRLRMERDNCQPPSEEDHEAITDEMRALVPEHILLQAELSSTLAQAVQALPQNEQNVILSHYIYEKKMPDIAEEVGRSRSAVYQDRRRGLQMLRTQLEAWDEQ